MIYFDTAYLAKCYLSEPGSKQVREFARQADVIACSDLGRAELNAVFHRHYREGRLDKSSHAILHQQFCQDLKDGIWQWLPVDSRIWSVVEQRFASLPPDAFLRGADAVHLATAQLHKLTDVYSNDRHLLAACAAFGLNGVNFLQARS